MFVFSVGLVAWLVLCTESACPTVEPAPGTSPTANYISGPSGAASDRLCNIRLAEGLNIAVSPDHQNTDLRYGYRYSYGTEVNITCSSKTTDKQGPQDQIFLYPCSANDDVNKWSDPTPSVTTLTLNSSTPAGNYWLGCWVASCTCGASPDPATFDATSMEMECTDAPGDFTFILLIVGHPAPQPTNFWCLSYDWGSLTCGWTLGSGTVQTTWSVSYWPPTQTSGSPIPCWEGRESIRSVSEGKEVNVTCTVDQQRYFVRHQTFVFQVSGSNTFGNLRENFTTTTDRSIVKLVPVKGLTVVPVPGNSTVVDVTWELPDRTKETDCEWRVRVLASGDTWRAMERLLEHAETVCKSTRILLDGLHAFVDYTIQTQIRLNGSQYWSDETEKQIKTPEDKPSQSPELTPGGYIRGDCSQRKCLSLYWKSVPAAAQNGEIIYYQAVVMGNGTIVANTTEKINGNSLTVNIGQRDDVTLVVFLSAGTSAGFSSPPSEIVIPPRLATPVPSDPEEINVERQQISVVPANTTYTVTWSAFPGNDEDDYTTVFWCKGHVFNPDVSRTMCLAGMEWTHLAPKITVHRLDLTEEVGLTWYFGVSHMRAGVSRGVTWNRCVYNYMGVPDRPTLQVISQSETEMKVSWNVNMCDVSFLKGLPVTYMIFYRRTDSANPSCLGESALNITAKDGVNSLVLRNLIHGATYGVCMRILTATNASDVSDVTVATLSVASTDVRYVSVFAGVLASVFAVGVVICILVLRRRLQLKAKMFPSGDSWLPKPKTHDGWDVQTPVERSLGTRSSPSHTVQMSHDAEIQDRPFTQTGDHNVSSWLSPVLDSNPTSSERMCSHREVLPPANISQPSLALVNGYFKAIVSENNSTGASTQSPGYDSRVNRTGSENKSLMSAEYCTVQPVARSDNKTVEPQRQINVRRADGEPDNTEDTVLESSSPSEGKGQELEHGPFSGPAGAVAGDMCEAGLSNTMELHLLAVPSEPSLHGGYISQSALCDVRINNTPCSRHVSESLPGVSCYISINDVVEGSTEVCARSQNSPKTLNCRSDRDDERTVASDVGIPRCAVERSEYLVFDTTLADKRTHSPHITTTPGADAATPYVKEESKFSGEGFTNRSQDYSVHNDQDRASQQTGYLPHHMLSDKMSLGPTTGTLTISEVSPWLGRTSADVSWEDGRAGNADINISVREREEEDKQPQNLMAISPSGYVLMEAEHRERAFTEEIRVDGLHSDDAGQPDNNLYFRSLAESSSGLSGELCPPNCSDTLPRAAENWRKIPPDKQSQPLMAISPGNGVYVLKDEVHRGRLLTALTEEIRVDDMHHAGSDEPDNNLHLQSFSESSTGLSDELYPPNHSDRLSHAAENWRKMPRDKNRTDDKENASHVTPYVSWEEAEIMSIRL